MASTGSNKLVLSTELTAVQGRGDSCITAVSQAPSLTERMLPQGSEDAAAAADGAAQVLEHVRLAADGASANVDTLTTAATAGSPPSSYHADSLLGGAATGGATESDVGGSLEGAPSGKLGPLQEADGDVAGLAASDGGSGSARSAHAVDSEGSRVMKHLEASLDQRDHEAAALEAAPGAPSAHMSDGHSDIASSMYNYAPSMADDGTGTGHGIRELREIPEASAPADLDDSTELPPMHGPVPTTNRPEINHADLARTGIRFGMHSPSCVAEAASTTNQSDRGSDDAGGVAVALQKGVARVSAGAAAALQGASPLASATAARLGSSGDDTERANLSDAVNLSDTCAGTGDSQPERARCSSAGASSLRSSRRGGDTVDGGEAPGSSGDDSDGGAGPGPAAEAHRERVARRLQQLQDAMDAASLVDWQLPLDLREQMRDLGRRGGGAAPHDGPPGTPDLKKRSAGHTGRGSGSQQAPGGVCLVLSAQPATFLTFGGLQYCMPSQCFSTAMSTVQMFLLRVLTHSMRAVTPLGTPERSGVWPISTPDPMTLTPPSAEAHQATQPSPPAIQQAHQNTLYDASPRSPSQPPLAQFPAPSAVAHPEHPLSPSSMAPAPPGLSAAADMPASAAAAGTPAAPEHAQVLEALQAQYSALAEQNGELQAHHNALVQTHDELAAAHAAALAKQAELQASLDAMQQEQVNFDEQLEAAQAQVTAAQAQHASVAAELASVQQQLSSAHEHLAAAQAEASDSSATMQSLAAAKHELEERADQLAADSAEASAALAAASDEAAALRAAADQLHKERDALVAAADARKQERQALAEEARAHKAELAQVRLEGERVAAENAALHGELDELRARHAALQAEYDAVVARSEGLQAALEARSAQLEVQTSPPYTRCPSACIVLPRCPSTRIMLP
jgi:trimeric autotransporter adhesin